MLSDSDKKLKEYYMLKQREYRQELYKQPILQNLFLEVTSRCNARCEHCGSRCDGNMQGEEISAEDLKKTLKRIAAAYDPQKILINVTGGEPLMRKDLFDIMAYANELGFLWGMTTNGMLITKSVVKKMEETGMCTVSVSVDGLEKTHEEFRKVPNSYQKIFEGIHMMQESPVIQLVQVTTVVNQKNIHELEDVYQLLLDNGVQYWRVISCDPIGRALDNSNILLDSDQYKYLFQFIQEKAKEGKMKDITYGCSHYLGPNLEGEIRDHYFMCHAGLTVGSILSNGDIFVCPNVPRKKELIQGNIKTDDFVDVWEHKFKFFRDEFRIKSKKCNRCPHWKYCEGDSLHTFDFDKKEPLICLKDIFDEI